MFKRRPPAAPGDPLSLVDTPAAIVDLDVLESNIRRAVAITVAAACGTVSIRPHAKAHKCAEIAALQIALSGGVTRGVTVQKVVEAEAMFAAGVTDILLTNEVVAPAKIARLAALAAMAARSAGGDIAVLVDDADNARALSAAVMAQRGGGGHTGTELAVLVECDVGQHRCGVPDARAAAALAALVASLPGLRLRGIQAYHGGAQHVRNVRERRAVAAAAAAAAAAARDAIIAAGLRCDVVSGGGTGTFWMDAASGVYTELQPGSYVLGDADYARNGRDPATGDGEGLCWAAPFPPSLMLLSQVMSVRPGEWAVIDSGLKAQSVDSGAPVVATTLGDYEAAGYALPPFDEAAGRYGGAAGALCVASVSDEHSTLKRCSGEGAGAATTELPSAGEMLLLVPGHCDPFVNHYDFLVGVRRGVVEAVWALEARSPGV